MSDDDNYLDNQVNSWPPEPEPEPAPKSIKNYDATMGEIFIAVVIAVIVGMALWAVLM